jgi:hypothetical protein
MGRGDDEECAGMTNREASRLKPDSACMRGFRGEPGMTNEALVLNFLFLLQEYFE